MAEGQGRSSGQGVKLLHIRDYLYREATRSHPKNAKHIIEYLANKGIAASRQTIYNDIMLLKYDFDVPVEYDKRKHGYYIAKPILEPFELRLIVDSVRNYDLLSEKEADIICNKIIRMVDKDTRETLLSMARKPNFADMNESVVRNTQKIYEAIAQDRKIGFRLFVPTPDPDRPRLYNPYGKMMIVSPYSIVFGGHLYVLYAYNEKRKKMQTYYIDFMGDITNPLPEKREGREEFIKHPYPEPEKLGDPINVRLLCANHAMIDIRPRYGNVITTPVGDFHFSVTVKTYLNKEFYGWLCTCGDGVKITDPDVAVKDFEQYLTNIACMYFKTQEEPYLSDRQKRFWISSKKNKPEGK